MLDKTASPPKVPPEFFASVCNAIGDRFNFAQLNAIIYRCAGDRRINSYANEIEPPRVIAQKCVEGIEKDGLSVEFFANVLTTLPEKDPLYALIVQAIPAAKTALPEIKTQIDSVLKGLEWTRSRLSVSATKDVLETSKTTLESVSRGISLLDGYKSLHDCLHYVQIKQFSILLSSVRASSIDDAQLEILREYQEQVRTSVDSARMIVGRLPNEPTLRLIETRWIDDLDTAISIYQKALDDQSSAAARIAILKLSRVLETEPPRLNNLIFAAAKELPLQALSNALQILGGDAGSTELIAANIALKNVEDTLRSRVAEHDMWQQIDKGIWYLDKLFTQSANQIEDFLVLWPEVKAGARTLGDLSQGAKWAANLKEYADRIEDALLLAMAPDSVAAKDPSRPKLPLARAFSAFRSEARQRFFVVDQLLKQDCSLLVGIGAPLKSILGNLSDA